MRAKHASGLLLSVLLVTSMVGLSSLIIAITSQTGSAKPSSENFTIIVLPDTQYYSQSYPEIFENQTKWIVQNENEMNIVFVTHLGDLINNYAQMYQWVNADNAMSILDNNVPYGLLPGNHDLKGGPSPAAGAPAPQYESYFPASRYEGYSYWGGSYDSESVTSSSPNMNNYQLFSAGGMNFITLSLQYNPPTDVVKWADNILSTYSNRRAIISTHSYINSDESWAPGGPVIFRDLVTPNKNVFLVLCGHELGEGEKIDNLDGRTVYQLLSDYQGFPNGGNGYLRIMKFVPSESTIQVKTYSPYLDRYLSSPSSQFDIYYPMSVAASAGGGISLMIFAGGIVVVILVVIAIVLILKVL